MFVKYISWMPARMQADAGACCSRAFELALLPVGCWGDGEARFSPAQQKVRVWSWLPKSPQEIGSASIGISGALQRDAAHVWSRRHGKGQSRYGWTQRERV